MAEKLRIGITGASGWMAGALAVGAEYDEKGFDAGTRTGRKNRISTVAGLCDCNEEALRRRSTELALTNARIFTSYDDMLAAKDIDAVIIAVPNNLHVNFAIKALHAGKHVFLEKPLATTLKDSQRLMDEVRYTDLTTKLDYILVHYDEQQNLRNLIEQGAFGDIVSAHFTYRHPIQIGNSPEQAWKLSKEKSGGAVPMGVCHAVSTAVFQMNADPETVICISNGPRIRSFDYDTQMDIMVKFANGAVCVIQGNIDFAEKYDARHTIIGTGGQFDYNPFLPLDSRVMWSSLKKKRAFSPDPSFARHHLDSGDVWKHQCAGSIQEFVNHAIKCEKDPLLGIESRLVRRVEAVIWAAEESAAKGAAVVDASAYLASAHHAPP